ncbi:carbon-nitrogen hydrolase family protein [bacterium]|nr:carbon-nitrogen hydrolase family protein [bacterium]
MSKVALVQITSTKDRSKNLEKALAFVDEAAANKADIVAFPENFLLLGEKEDYLNTAESIPGPHVKIFMEKALRNNISILMGSLYEQIPGNQKKAFNTSVLIDKLGNITATYRKIHLFDVSLKDVVLSESELVEPGKNYTVTDHELGKIGLTICYDVRFPNLYQKLTQEGAIIVFVPAAFTVPTGKAHWINLLRTRAIENQVYIAAPAQFGKHSLTRESFGSTVFIDPWGDVQSILPEGEGIIYGEIDYSLLENVRKRMPVQAHRVKNIDY